MSEIPKEKIKRNSLLNQKIKKNLNNIIKEIENIGKLGDLQVEDYIKAMKIPPIDRKIKDLAYIKKFLEKSALAQKFKGDNFNEESLDQILTSCAAQLKYFHLEKDKVLFKIGEEPDNFYLILNGKIGILKPFSYYSEMTGLEYFYHIEQLKKNNEMYILKQTLEKNYTVFKYDYNDINIVSTVVMKILIEDYFSFGINHYNSRTIEEILKICGFKENYFNVLFDSCLKDDKEYVSKMERIILKKIPKVKKRLIEKYRHLSSESGKFRVTLFEYKTILELGNNFFFGDTALDKTTTRNATIKTVEDTDFCYLELDYYISYLKDEKRRLTMKEVLFLVDNFFFKNISPQYFEKKFLNQFIYEEKYKSEFIVRENEPAEFIYFIKKGTCDIYMKKNIFEIYNLICYLSQLETDPNFNINECFDSNFKNDFFTLQNQFKEVKKIKLFNLNIIDVIGLESIYFGLNYLYNVKVTSETITYYKIELKHLMSILQDEPICYFDFKSDSFNKVNILIQRLKNLNKTNMELIDDKETIRIKSIEKDKENEKKSNKNIDFEFGESNYQKQNFKMKNQFNKKFGLIKDNQIMRKITTFSQILKQPSKKILNNLKQNLKSLSPLPSINNNNNLNTIQTYSNSNINEENLSEKKNKNKGLINEKNMLKKIKKQKEDDDKFFITLNSKNGSNNSFRKIFSDSENMNMESNNNYCLPNSLRLKKSKSKINNLKYQKLTTIKSSDMIDKKSRNNPFSINTDFNFCKTMNKNINSNENNNNSNENNNNNNNNEYKMQNYTFRGKKNNYGKIYRTKYNFYKKYKLKMTSDDLFLYEYKSKL